mgnify:CR=1 FL=1
MDCPKCGTRTTIESDDGRQEWRRILYRCEECDRSYSRLITYKAQSPMVQSDNWEDYE